MFCERCGTRLEEGGLVCVGCGSVQSRGEPAPRPVQTAEQTFFDGPTCVDHPGKPLLGQCPRCGKDVCVRCAPEAVSDVLTCTACMGLTDRHAKAPSGATCATHPGVSAAFVCARCGSFACSGCRATGLVSQGLCFKCETSSGPLASRSARFGANLVDTFVVFVPMVVAVMVPALTLGKSQQAELEALLTLALVAGLFFGAAIQLAALIAWGQSIGKHLFGLVVVKLDGSPCELWRLLLLRNVVPTVLANLCGIFGLIDALAIFGTEQRCLHDYIAGTNVVEKR